MKFSQFSTNGRILKVSREATLHVLEKGLFVKNVMSRVSFCLISMLTTLGHFQKVKNKEVVTLPSRPLKTLSFLKTSFEDTTLQNILPSSVVSLVHFQQAFYGHSSKSMATNKQNYGITASMASRNEHKIKLSHLFVPCETNRL